MDRNLESARNFAKGLVYLDFSFLTNGAADPLKSTWRGGGIDGIASVVHAATGRYTITMKDKCRYIVGKTPNLEDLVSGSDDGAYASDGPVSNEGSSTLAPSFDVFTRAGATTTKTDYTGRRCFVSICIKNSTVGT